MSNYQFSKQDVIRLLSQLRKIRMEYPPELLAARRKLYLNLIAQLAATHVAVTAKRKQLVSSIVREPDSTVIKVLIVVFVAFLIAFVAHTIANGNVNFGWLMELLSP